MAFQSKIKCSNCGTFNTNSDYCENCGALINPKLKREKSDQKRHDDREEEDRNRVKGKFELFIERNLNHKFILIRLFFQLLYGIWFVVMAIGAFIAWLFAAVAA